MPARLSETTRPFYSRVLQPFALYVLLCLVLEWRFFSGVRLLPWHAIPVSLAAWLLLRWGDSRRPTHPERSTEIRRWIESHVIGLLLSGAALRFFFGASWSLLAAVVGWGFLIVVSSELVTNAAARTILLGWSRQRVNVVWPRMGVVSATCLAVWFWDRLLLSEDLTAAIYAWVAGASGVVVWLAPNSDNRWWRALLAPLVAVVPIIGFLGGTPAGEPKGTLVFLAAMALLMSCLHTAFARGPGARSLEIGWIWLLGLAGLWLCEPLLNAQSTGGGDAQWYALVMADAIAQWRAGMFPPLVGQSIYAFSGSSFPGCFAPYFQLTGIAIDVLTGGLLSPFAIKHATAMFSIIGGIFSAYGVLRALVPRQRSGPGLLALIYGASPAWLGALYSMDMYMTTMALPWLPLVIFGCVRTFIKLDFTTMLWLVAPLSIVWYAHPPVALWMTLAAVASQFFRLATRRRRWQVELGWACGASLLFAALTCLPFASAGSAERSSDLFRHDYVLRTMAEHWATAWKPVSSAADRLNDQHLGWSLALVALVGGCFAMWKNQRSLCALVTSTSCLLVLLIPLPGAQDAIWRAIPEAIKTVTNNWPTQRIYPVLASLATVACGATLLRVMRRRERVQRWVTGLLALAAVWSFSEATKFKRRGHITTLSLEASARRLYPENLVLTRYAYEMFSQKPAYFAHGVMNPLIKHRLLEETSLEEIVTNTSAASSGAKSKNFTVHNQITADGHYELTPDLRIRPGRQYLLEFDFEARDYVGDLFLKSERLERNYHLPSDGGPRAFGSGPTQSKFITLWTSGNAPEVVRWHYQPTSGAIARGRFAKVRMTEIEPERLPVQTESLLPYRALVRASTSAWLETPRMFLRGYEAAVAGKTAEVRKSPQGLVMIRLPAGEAKVELRYVGPPIVRIAFWVACFAWVGIAVTLVSKWAKVRLPARARPQATMPGPRAFPHAPATT